MRKGEGEMEIKLGQKVEDRVTGFTGIAVSRTEFLQGCCRIEVQPTIDKEGKIPDLGCFDEPQLKVVGNGLLVEEPKEKKTGGPHFGLNPSRPQIHTHK